MAITKEAALCADSLGIRLERLEVLDKFFTRLVDNGVHTFCAARILRRGVEVFSAEYGVQEPGGGKLRADAIYPMQSVTKPVVATALAILQEDGEIDLLDSVQRYFPEFSGEGKEGIQLWHLLCHCSGMDEEAAAEFANTYIKNELGIEVPEESQDGRLDAFMLAREKMGMPETEKGWGAVNELFWKLRLMAPLKTAPGTAFSYYSTGYQLSLDLICKLTGESIDSFAQRKIFEPLGMKDTCWVLPKKKWNRVVKREEHFPGGQWLHSEDSLISNSGGGGLKSTLDDLARFGQMFLQEGTFGGRRILSPASVRLMTTDHNPDIPPSFWLARLLGANWGLGWNVKNGKKDDLGMLRSDRAYDHGGYGGARLMIDPDYELVTSLYMVEYSEDEPYPNMSRVMNIIYSALD